MPIISKSIEEKSEDTASIEKLEVYFDYTKAIHVTSATIGEAEYSLPFISLAYQLEKEKNQGQTEEKRNKRKMDAQAKEAIEEFKKKAKVQKEKDVGIPVKRTRKTRK